MIDDFLKRKDRIIITAVQLLDEKGIKGLTTKEIARRQNITEPAIYKHFKSKKEIVKVIIESFAAFDEGIRNTIRESDMGARESIRFIVKTYVTNYENYPEIVTPVFSFDVFKYDKDLNDRMISIISGRDSFIKTIVRKGYETGEIIADIESDEYACIISDTIWMSICSWKLGNCSTSLKESVIGKIEFLLDKTKS